MSPKDESIENKVDRTRVSKSFYAKKALKKVANTYQKADQAVVSAAKKAVPQKTLNQLSKNKKLNNGNIRIALPIKSNKAKKIELIVPGVLAKVRHASLPVALITVAAVFAFAGASPPNYSWTKQVGGLGNDGATDIAIDDNGNTYTAGYYQGTVDFGNDWSEADSKTSSGSGLNHDIFISKIDNSGGYSWTKTIHGDDSVPGQSITTDSSGNIYITGSFTDSIDFGSDWSVSDTKTSNGDSDVFITKVNSDGSYGWTKQVGGLGKDSSSDLVVDATGNLYIAGQFEDSVTFDTDFGSSTDTKTSNGESDVFILEIDGSGDYVSTKQIGGDTGDEASAITTDSSGNIYITGSFTDSIDFGSDWSVSDTKTSNGDSDVFITKVNSDGSYGWTKQVGGSANDTPAAIAVSQSGGVFVGGEFSSATVDFGADWAEVDAKNRTGTVDSFVLQINNLGGYVSTKTIGGASSSVNLTDLSLDDENNLFIAGNLDGEVDLGLAWGGTAVKTSEDGGFVAKIMSDGVFKWAGVPDVSNGSAQVSSLAIDGDGAVIVAGIFTGGVDFAADYDSTDSKTSSNDSNDAYVTKIARGSDAHTIVDADGLTFKDSEGLNLSSAGTTDTNPLVYILNQSDEALIATISVDLTENRDWSSISGASDSSGLKSYINNAIGAPGADSKLTFYVPKGESDTAVALCPGAESLSAVSASCPGKYILTAESANAAVQTIEDVDYWAISNISDTKIGGMSVDKPRVMITETSGSTEVAENGSTDFIEVRLDARPAADVDVQINFEHPDQIDAAEEITFTSTNWDDPVLVEIVATDDNFIEGEHQATIGYLTSSSDSAFNTLSEEDLITVEITDNDEAGVELTATSNLTSESGSTTQVCANLTAKPTHSVLLEFSSSNTSEASVSSPLTIAANQWNSDTNCVTVTGVDDDEVDGPKNVTIRVSGIDSDDSNFDSLNTDDISAVQITNQDNDTASFTVTAGSTTTSESGDTAQICIKLSARPTSNVVIPVSSSDLTEGSIGSVTNITIIPANWNSNSNCVTVTGQDDNLIDGDIEYQLITGDPTSSDDVWNDLGANDVADQTLINTDDDEAGFTLSNISAVSVTEGGSSSSFGIVLSSEPTEGKKVAIRVAAGSELRVGSTPSTESRLEFDNSNWNVVQNVTIIALDDDNVEGSHSGNITVSIHEDTDDSDYVGLTSQNFSVSISDNDIATASVSTINDGSEGSEASGKFRVNLDKPNYTGSDIKVDYIVSGNAVSGQHYVALSGEAIIAHGQDSVDISVDLTGKDNDLLEGNKTVTIELDSVDSPLAQIGESASSTVVIYDDETAEVSIEIINNGQEEDEQGILIKATLSKVNNTGASVTVRLNDVGGDATAGQDYEDFDAQQIAILDGTNEATYEIAVIDDELFESITEKVKASIDSPSLSSLTIDEDSDEVEATITDNDTAEISIAAENSTANENPSSNGAIRITLDKANNTGASINVNYSVGGTATEDEDYVALSGSVSISNGQQYSDVIIDTTDKDDDDMEGNETVILTYASNSNDERVNVGASTSAQVTIIDDEIAGVTVSATDDTTGEDGSTGKICATLSSRPSHDVTIHLSSEDDAKVTVPSTLTISRNNWNVASENCVTVTGHDDSPAAVTGIQNVVISTDNVTSDDEFYNALTGADVQNITIKHVDNDAPSVVVESSSTITSEDGSKSAVVSFRLGTRPTGSVEIPVSVSDSTEGSIGSVESVVIDPDDWNSPTSNQITIYGVDDDLTDGDITYVFETGKPLSGDASYNSLTSLDVDNVQLTNEDDDEAGVTFTGSSSLTLQEGESEPIELVINSQPASGNKVVVKAVPADIQLDLGEGAGVAIELEFDHSNWNQAKQINVEALNDELLESDHASEVTYEIVKSKTTEGSYSDYSISNKTQVEIIDTDSASAVLTLANGNEAGPIDVVAAVELSKENNTGQPITFNLDPSGGSAAAGSDYVDFSNTTISVADGQSSAQVVLAVIDDSLLEGDETIEVDLTNPSLSTVSVDTQTVSGTIIDNDTAEVTIVATVPTAYESPAESGEFTVYLSKVNNTSGPISVSYDVSGTAEPNTDYSELSGVIEIPVGQSSATITVSTSGYNDDQVEGPKTVIVALSDTSHNLVDIGSIDEASVTIEDDDSFTFSIQKIQDGIEGQEDITFRVRLSQVNTTGAAVTVQIADTSAGTASASEDYQVFGGVVSIPNGQQSVDYSISVINDDDLEDIYETVQASISNPSEGDISTSSATANIEDDESGVITIEKTADAAESPSSNGQFVVTLDKSNHSSDYIGVNYTVNGTATGGLDYALLSGSAMIPSGQTSTVINVDTSGYDDNLFEGDETVIVTLTSSGHPNVTVGEPSSATAIISDDDPEPKEDEDDDEELPAPGNNSGGGGSSQPSPVRPPVAQGSSNPQVTRTIIQREQESASNEEDEVDTPTPQPIEQKKEDQDKDGINDEDESKANNFGDGNGDGIPDSKQSNVASLISSVTSKPVTLESRGECADVTSFAVISETTLKKKDNRHKYPYGLVDFTLECPQDGAKSTVTVFYDQALNNANNWRKFTNSSNAFASMDFVDNLQKPVGTSRVTATQYIVEDGGFTDGDGKKNSEIVDPAGYAVRSFHVLDLGWIIPVLAAGGFVGYALWHRVRDHRRYR